MIWHDTIAAIATAPGEGGIAVIRISGPDALCVIARIFIPKSHRRVVEFSGYSVRYGHVVEAKAETSSESDRSAAVDDVLLTVFRAPNSYTREDVCEISCHGGAATTRIVLNMVLGAGARLAEPGEFTQRAFLNGRLDLAQAEAVADLVKARTESARRLARRQLDGTVSRAVAAIREDLIGIVAAIEVTIDFSDEVGDLDISQIQDRLQRSLHDIVRLLSTASKGRVMRDGLSVVIIGRPNVGKSSLLNALLRSNRAIVTPIPGTTRDTIEESITIHGVPVVLTDTAGLRETDDAVERIGVERTHEAVRCADVTLFVLDASVGILDSDTVLIDSLLESGDSIFVWNKSDLIEHNSLSPLTHELANYVNKVGTRAISVSALNSAGIEDLENALVAPYMVHGDSADFSAGDPVGSSVVSSVRHTQALQAASRSLNHAARSAEEGMPGDFIAIDVRGALDALGLITGETVTEDIIHRIFKDFCVGK